MKTEVQESGLGDAFRTSQETDASTKANQPTNWVPEGPKLFKHARNAHNLGPEPVVSAWLSRMRQAADGAIQAENKEAA
jgi:hypothetical protein